VVELDNLLVVDSSVEPGVKPVVELLIWFVVSNLGVGGLLQLSSQQDELGILQPNVVRAISVGGPSCPILILVLFSFVDYGLQARD